MPDLPGVRQIEVFSRWLGFASPPERSATCVIRRAGEGYERTVGDGKPTAVSSDDVAALMSAIAGEPVPTLDPAAFEYPSAVLKSHYESRWTDDHPQVVVRVVRDDADPVTLRSAAQHAFMLPFEVSGGGTTSLTYVPDLPKAIARLLPKGFLNRERLDGRSGFLESALAHFKMLAAGTGDVPVPTGGTGDDDAPESPAERLLEHVSLDEVRTLLADGASPDVADDVGQTAAMHAMFPPVDLERFRLLAAAGADLEARREDGYTGLHLACAGGMHVAAAGWVAAGADVEARTPAGATPLMLAASWPKIVGPLLAAGADVHAADEEGDTPLAYAVRDGIALPDRPRREAIRHLLRAGADADRVNRQGQSPLVLARQAVSEVLESVAVDEALFRAAHDGEPPPMPRRDLRGRELAAARAVVELLERSAGAIERT